MAVFPKEIKPLGYTVKQRQGDWTTTYEVVGYNQRNGCNIWAEKVRRYTPDPPLSETVAAIERDRDMKRIKMIRKNIEL